MRDYPSGYAGTILRVDLTTRKVVRQKLDTEIISHFIGGRGINAKYLYDEVSPDTDPLGPENKIIFGIGPCAGTTAPGAQRYNITAKSPLTGFFGDSNSGGDFGAALKYAGYDMIILEGRSDLPVYLFINDDHVELRPADHLWGKTTFETRRSIEREVSDPGVCVASIGPAGENLVRFSCIITDIGRAAGRTGMGAILGSKKVKAVAVKGTQGVTVADYEMLKKLNRENYQLWRSDPDIYKAWIEYGPTKGWRAYALCGMLPTKNFQEGVFEKNLFEEMVEKRYLVKQKSCLGCPLGCNHSFLIRTGPYAGTAGEGVELTQLGDFGPRVGNDDLALALKADTLCDEYGVDIMDMSGVIAYAMECYEKGILSAGDVNGIRLDWGNAEAILSLIEMIVQRKGLGIILGEGLSKAAAAIGKGSEKYAMQVKGQALVMRDVRASKAWALMYAVSSRGACHMRAWVPEGYGAGGTMAPGIYDQALLHLLENYQDPLNQQTEEGKAEMVKWCEDLRALRDTLNICHFSLYRLSVDTKNESSAELYAKYLNAVTGSNLSGREGLLIGERICNLERAFNVRAGLSRKDDNLPDRMLKEPLPKGPSKGQVVDLEPMLDRYYELRGWDKVSGIPTREKLLDLGLADVADDLTQM